MMNILVLESSTTSAKAMLYSTKNGVVNTIDKVYEKKYPDTSIHDAEMVFSQTVALGKQMCVNREIDIIVLSGTWHSVMLCDKQINPVTPVYTWAFVGANDLCKKLRMNKEYTKNFYNRTGCMVNAIYPAFKLMLLKEQGYDLSQYFIMGQGSYNYYKLTGQRVVMDSMASGSGLLNTHTKQYDSDILKEIGISDTQLGRIVSYRDTYPLTKEGAELLGLKQGIPVVPTGPDGGLNQVGAGALKDGVMTFSVGTSGALRLSAQKPIISENQSTWCYMSPYSWLSGVATSGCCNCVDWVKDKLFNNELSYLDIERNFSNTSFDNMVVDQPVFLPFLFGERCPGWNDERNASFNNVKPEHSAFDIYHSVLEGTLYNLYQSYLELTELNGLPKKIKLSGGILHSKYWSHMCADIFNMEMEVDETQHSSLMGGAVLGLALLDEKLRIEDFEVPSNCKIVPNTKNNKVYLERYNNYLKYYYLDM
jgi:gluconokinase